LFGDGVGYLAGVRCDVAIKDEGEVSECVGAYVRSIDAMGDAKSCRVRGRCARRKKSSAQPRSVVTRRVAEFMLARTRRKLCPWGAYRQSRIGGSVELFRCCGLDGNCSQMMLLASVFQPSPRHPSGSRQPPRQVDECCGAGRPSLHAGVSWGFGPWR
jgi:hypothetical protein